MRAFCTEIDEKIDHKAQEEQREGVLHQVASDHKEIGTFLSKAVQCIPAKTINPDLEIEIETHLDAIQYSAKGENLRIENPDSLWPCTCLDAWTHDRNDQCLIHSNPSGNAISEEFLNGIILTKYRDTDIYWFHSESLFPVTIDPLYMYENMRQDGITDKEIPSVLEVGCGTGIISLLLATHNDSLADLYLCDHYVTPLGVSGFNHHVNELDSNCNLFLSDGFTRTNDLSESNFDVAICNPPYLPEMDSWPEGMAVPGFTGVDLLSEAIANADVAETVYLGLSEVAEQDAKVAASEQGVELVPIGERRTVPFRVHPSLDTTEYIEFLLERGLQTSDSRYPYQHDIMTYKLVAA